jgi:hypothetical protein
MDDVVNKGVQGSYWVHQVRERQLRRRCAAMICAGILITGMVPSQAMASDMTGSSNQTIQTDIVKCPPFLQWFCGNKPGETEQPA